jgi:5'-3' exonuclease
MKRVLIIDGLNSYYRAYICDPSVSSHGQPIGGIKGFIKILQRMCREVKPDRIVICWDGPGGSRKRRTQNKNYKSGRKPIKLNRNIHVLSVDEELENKVWQQTELVDMLNDMPVIQLLFPEVEADDIISCVAQAPVFSGWQKIIVSSDKDFIQLCDDDVILYRPSQKQILNKPRIIETYGIHPTNFALARAIAGDPSDNIKGVQGVGLTTVSKRFVFLKEEKSFTFKDIYDFCDEVEKKLKVHTSILENKKVIENNYKLMQLYSPSISVQSRKKVNYILENADLSFNKTAIMKTMYGIGFGELNWSDLSTTLRRISVEK